MEVLQGAEYVILYWFQKIGNPVLDRVMVALTTFGNRGAFFLLLGICLCIPKKTRRMGTAVLLSLAAGFLIGNLFLKNVMMRARPCWQHPWVSLLIQIPEDYSFPSGHSLASFETAVSVYLYNHRWGTLLLMLAAGIAVSRLYLFVHFPTDVLAGALLGTLIAWGVHKVLEKRENCGMM